MATTEEMEPQVDVKLSNDFGNDLCVTLRGSPTAIVKALAGGLSKDDLRRIHDAITAEFNRRLE